jgi:energy-coupling factor transport system permease protein
MTSPFVSLGRYLPGSSIVHRLDARAKLLAAFLLACGSVWSHSLLAQSVVLGLLLVASGVARLPRSLLWRALVGVTWLLLFVAVANALWFWLATNVSWAQPPVGVHSLAAFLALLVRLVNLLVLAVLFTASTVPVDAAEALQSLLRPLRRLRLPVQEVALLLSLSISFIPLFLDEARNLSRAHRMKRGMASWGWRDRMAAAIPLMVPLFLSVLRRSDDLAIAMESRCYAPGRPRTSLVQRRTGWPEGLLLAGTVALCVLLLLHGR